MGLFSWLFGNRVVVVGDGSSAAQAVVVGSVSEEYAWVQKNCPGFQLQMQSLQNIDGKPYDVLALKNDQGEERNVYFDISQFFGKF
jgi:cation diffusion facilitator CzcD-associated flavoprotein CzcO